MTRVRGHYSFVTRTLLTLFEAGDLRNVSSIEVEPEYGYTTRIHYRDNSLRMTRGNDVGLNSSAAAEVAGDKDHTKFFLKASKIKCPEGSAFLLPWWADQIRSKFTLGGGKHMRLPQHAANYAGEILGYPVFVKPVDGSQGSNIFKCHRQAELDAAFDVFERERVRVAMVEKAVPFPDHRLVVLDDRVISTYRREPITVEGNGTTTIDDLLDAKLAEYAARGRAANLSIHDRRVEQHLRQQGLIPESVPSAGTEIRLLPLSNLSLGGTAQDLTDVVALRWKDFAITVARTISLRYCGVDLACADILDPDSDYSVLEVNAAPGLDHYAEIGPEQEQRVRSLYAQVFDALPEIPKARAL